MKIAQIRHMSKTTFHAVADSPIQSYWEHTAFTEVERQEMQVLHVSEVQPSYCMM